MAMRKRPQDLKIPRDRRLPRLQPSANDIYEVGRQVREIADRLVLDLALLAKGSPEQMSLLDAIFVDASRSGHVGGTVSGWHTVIIAA